MPLEIPKETYDGLKYDLDAAVAEYTAAMEAHKFTVDVPAPTADPMVEMVYRAGGYVIVEPPKPAPKPFEPLFDMGQTMNQILTSG